MISLYDKEIEKVQNIFSEDVNLFSGDSQDSWPVLPSEELILKSDMALDLGGGEAFGISGILFTTEEALVPENRIFIKGSSILELAQKPEKKQFKFQSKTTQSDNEVNYARFTVIRLKKDAVENRSTQQLYATFRKMDYVRYHFFPEGFALRISTVQHREVVRISKAAVDKKISFERIGREFIKAYCRLPEVDSVQIYFLTSLQKSEEFKQLDSISRKSDDITESLNEIFKGLKMDCSTCGQKALCDEIEGLKELHAKTVEK